MTKKHLIVHSSDATTIIIAGDKRSPEPTYAIVKFPGGSIEVSRHADGSYWIHGGRTPRRQAWESEPEGRIVESRIDYEDRAAEGPRAISPGAEHIALRIALA